MKKKQKPSFEEILAQEDYPDLARQFGLSKKDWKPNLVS